MKQLWYARLRPQHCIAGTLHEENAAVFADQFATEMGAEEQQRRRMEHAEKERLLALLGPRPSFLMAVYARFVAAAVASWQAGRQRLSVTRVTRHRDRHARASH